MMQNNTAQEKFNQLRRQAEALMLKPDFSRTPVDVEDPLRLIYELQTYQVELELQNDALQLTQQELTEFKINYTQLFDFTPVGYVILDSKGAILNANLTLADMLSMERNMIIKRRLSEYIRFEDQDIYFLHLQTLFESKTRQVCGLKMKRNDGTFLDVQLETTVIPEYCKGDAKYRTVIIDVTQRKRAELLLKYGRRQLESVLNNIEASIYVADMTSYEILFMNRYMKQLYKRDLTGSICWKSIHKNQKGPCEFCTNDKLLDDTGNPSEPYSWEFYNDVFKKWYEVNNLAIPWMDGRFVRLELAKDITDRKKIEQRQKQINTTLEDKVKERTAELEDMNATLRILLKKREADRDEIGEMIFANHKMILAPLMDHLKKSLTQESQREMMTLLESELTHIISPFSKQLSDRMVNLTPKEIHVANLIKSGKSNKEISEILNTSTHTISRHRENIRKKTGLKNKKVNLRSFLLTLQ